MADNTSDLYFYRCSIFGHTLDVRALESMNTASGSLVSGSRDKTVKIWKSQGPDHEFIETKCLLGPTHFIASLCFLPPSSQHPQGLLLAGSNDCAIYVFAVDNSQPIFKLLGHSNTVCSLSAGNFGTVVSGSWDKTARVWLGQKCVAVLEGHQAAVWAVTIFPDHGITLTGSADRTIRLWRSATCEKIFKGHEDCVRGLVVVSGSEFLSCSNDNTVRLWETNGTCLQVFTGHTNYVYGITLINETGEFATCSEDHSVKVWKKSIGCTQTIQLPCKTLWSITCLANDDLAVGGSDGSIRVFTRSKDLIAPPDHLLEFENEVSVAHQNAGDMIGDLNLEDVPGMEVLTAPGAEEGQTTLCRDGSTVYVFQWSSKQNEWIKVGDVCDAHESNKKYFEGKDYDYIFNIDVEEGKYLKLPYNLGENPWSVARKFIEKHNLSQLFLDQIANFIVANTQPEDINDVDPLENCDPFTGENRYVPRNLQITGNPPSGDNRPMSRNLKINVNPHAQPDGNAGNSSKNPYFPMTKYLKFDSANIEGLKKKLIEFSEKVDSSLKVSAEEIVDVLLLADFPTTITEQQMTVLDKIMSWPPEHVFPALDLFRLAVRGDAMNQKVRDTAGFALVNYLLKHLEPSNIDANQMLVLRTFCNFFGHSSGESLVIHNLEKICAATLCCVPSSNKNIQIGVATLYINLAVALNKSLLSDAELLSINAIKIATVLTESEAAFRIFVAIGTLMENDVAKNFIKSSDFPLKLPELLLDEWQDKVKLCAQFILEGLC